MQKNWYILYTKAKCEKKVSSLLTRKKIKNFCPVHGTYINQLKKIKLVYKPLFSSYVFVYVKEQELDQVKQLNNVVNLVFWKDAPAIIQNDEIEEITKFVRNHQNINLERSRVNLNCTASLIDRPSYAVDGNVVIIKNEFIKVNLPSLGYVMIAEIEGEGVMGRQMKGGKRKQIAFEEIN